MSFSTKRFTLACDVVKRAWRAVGVHLGLDVGGLRPLKLGHGVDRACEEREGLQGDYTPFLLMLQGMAPPITRDYPPSLLILQGMTLQLQGIALHPF